MPRGGQNLRWTREAVAQAIATWVRDHGVIPTARQLDREPALPPGRRLRELYGSAPAAWRALGYEPRHDERHLPDPVPRHGHRRYWTTERCREAVRAWMAAHDDQMPRTWHLTGDKSLPGHNTLIARFGSMAAFWKALGVAPPAYDPRSATPAGGLKRDLRLANRQMVTGRTRGPQR
jgi:hypothetical protein